ncbi:MAG: winged helix-turn-helix transcriptional regulator [Candidatus Thorarchaeota archaeon]|jgi:DNA-binding Lrp family transcriptional regulator
MVVTLDKIDMTILREMDANCRASYRAIARKTGLSPNAVKNRLTKLIEGGVITDFLITLTYETADVDSFLAVVCTDGSESVQDLVSYIGGNPMVYHVSALVCVTGGAYVVAGEHSSTITLAEIGAFLRGMDKVLSVELHPMLTTDLQRGQKVEFSRAQLRILKCLIQDPRMQISDIAEMTGMASKTVRRALKEIEDGEGVRFTARYDFAAGGLVDPFIRIIWNDKKISADELVQWLRHEYPAEFYYPWTSASDSVMFADFVVGDLSEAERISNHIRGAPFVLSTTILVGLSGAKFPHTTEIRLEEMLENAGV